MSGKSPEYGYTAVPNWLILHPSMTPSTLRVFLALATHADARTGKAWPSHSTIAAEADCSRDTVQRALGVLRDAGAVTWVKGGKGNRYTVAVGAQGPLHGAAPEAPRSRTRAASVAAPMRHKQEPENKTQEQHTAAAAAHGPDDTSEGLFRVVSEEHEPMEKVPHKNDLYAAWIDGYRETHGGADPDPAVRGPLLGQVKNIGNSRTDLESWRTAWHAFKAAGRNGSTYVLSFLVPKTQQPAPWQKPSEAATYLTPDRMVEPPPGLTDEQYLDWYADLRAGRL